MSDVRVAAARDFHTRVGEAEERAQRYRNQRDRLIRELRAEDPTHWTYPRLALAVQCSAELVASVVRAGKGAPNRGLQVPLAE